MTVAPDHNPATPETPMTDRPFEPDYRPPADQLAAFDQAYAEATEHLDAMTAAHREHLAEGTETRELCIAGLAAWILAESDLPSAAQILAVAIHRLAEPAREAS